MSHGPAHVGGLSTSVPGVPGRVVDYPAMLRLRGWDLLPKGRNSPANGEEHGGTIMGECHNLRLLS